MLLELSPEACFGLEREQHIVATTTVVSYGRQLAYIGMVLTHPDYRRLGFARRLMRHALAYVRECGIVTVKLDATDAGRPLYEALGFRSEQAIERWIRRGGAASHDCIAPSAAVDLPEIDMEACGYDRSTLIHRLGTRSYRVSDSSAYVLCRPGRLNAYLGPCVAQSPSDARRGIASVLQTAATAGWYWDLFPNNTHAAKIATEFGFTRDRLLTRMVLGPDWRGREEWIYAIAGFELG